MLRVFNWLRSGLGLGVLLVVLPTLTLAPYFQNGTEIARARNALLLDEHGDASVDWVPPAWPKGFLLEDQGPVPAFTKLAGELGLASLSNDWDRALAIASHLLTACPDLHGGAIQEDLETTYRRITTDGDGYCVDFVRVFTAIGHAAGMELRWWAFSFEGFGGDGHIFAEIWNRQDRSWQALDVFNNTQFLQGGKPISLHHLKVYLAQDRSQLELKPIDERARPAFRDDQHAWSYYERGMPELYLWWGCNPHSYEQSFSVKTFSGTSRSLAQLGAIAQGVHPRIRIWKSEKNREQVSALKRTRFHLLAVGIAVVFGGLLILMSLILRRRRGRRKEAQPLP